MKLFILSLFVAAIVAAVLAPLLFTALDGVHAITRPLKMPTSGNRRMWVIDREDSQRGGL